MFWIESWWYFLSSFFSINSLQTELNNIFMLRKQLEDDILANRNLQKVLEDQIKDIKNRQGLYTCTAHPFSWSSCTKENWFYYSRFNVMEKKGLRVVKGVKRLLFGFLHWKLFGGFVTKFLSNLGKEGQLFSFHASNVSNSMAILLQWPFQAAYDFVPIEFTVFCRSQRFLALNKSVGIGSLSDHGM